MELLLNKTRTNVLRYESDRYFSIGKLQSITIKIYQNAIKMAFNNNMKMITYPI